MTRLLLAVTLSLLAWNITVPTQVQADSLAETCAEHPDWEGCKPDANTPSCEKYPDWAGCKNEATRERATKRETTRAREPKGDSTVNKLPSSGESTRVREREKNGEDIRTVERRKTEPKQPATVEASRARDTQKNAKTSSEQEALPNGDSIKNKALSDKVLDYIDELEYISKRCDKEKYLKIKASYISEILEPARRRAELAEDIYRQDAGTRSNAARIFGLYAGVDLSDDRSSQIVADMADSDRYSLEQLGKFLETYPAVQFKPCDKATRERVKLQDDIARANKEIDKEIFDSLDEDKEVLEIEVPKKKDFLEPDFSGDPFSGYIPDPGHIDLSPVEPKK